MNWKAHIDRDGDVRLYRLTQDGETLSFHTLFGLLEHDSRFADWYTQTLADCGLEAFFWEHPPLTTHNLDDEAEFALLPAPALTGLAANQTPFARQFERQPGHAVINFENLGGDALLIVPCPIGPLEAYPHLAAFARTAPASQLRALWRLTARGVLSHLGDSPRWLSTSGLGVAWLHLRLDNWPKYYQYAPYRTH